MFKLKLIKKTEHSILFLNEISFVSSVRQKFLLRSDRYGKTQ